MAAEAKPLQPQAAPTRQRRDEAAYRAALRLRQAVGGAVRSWNTGPAAAADTHQLEFKATTVGLTRREQERLKKRRQRALGHTQPREAAAPAAAPAATAAATASQQPTSPETDTIHALSSLANAAAASQVHHREFNQPTVQRRDGTKAKIAYAFHANADHCMSRHVLPDEIVEAIGERALQQLWNEDRHDYGLERIPADVHGATEDDDYSMIESHAVPFYLEHIFDRQNHWFTLCPVPLAILQELLLELRSRSGSNDSSSASSSVIQTLNPALREAWTLLLDCEILCVPSVLLLSNACTLPEWFGLLRQLESVAQLHVFPDISVESEMEQKERYLSKMMGAPPRAIWSEQVEILYAPHTSLLPPTVLLPSFAQWEQRLTRVESLSLLEECMKRLRSEVEEGGWKVVPGQWVVKGTSSTRCHAMQTCTTAAQMLRFMQIAHRSPSTSVAAPATAANGAASSAGPHQQQPGFILQPFLCALDVEARSFFFQGTQHQLTLLTERVSNPQQCTAMRTWEVRGSEPSRQQHHAYSTCLPQLLAFDQRALAACQAHCQLVTHSGLLRVDTGVEFLACEDVTEAQQRTRQHCPEQWHSTGRSQLVRFFCNEVTSTLDINWFSSQTSSPIVYAAAFACAQQLVQRLQARASAGFLK